MTYHQTEYDDLLELVWKLPDKAQLLLRQRLSACRAIVAYKRARSGSVRPGAVGASIRFLRTSVALAKLIGR